MNPRPEYDLANACNILHNKKSPASVRRVHEIVGNNSLSLRVPLAKDATAGTTRKVVRLEVNAAGWSKNLQADL